MITGDKNLDNLLTKYHETSLEYMYYKKFGVNLTNLGDTDFNVNFDNVWKIIGYSRKDNGKYALVKNFKEDVDYILKIPSNSENNKHKNNQSIYLTMNCFKSFCMCSNTRISSEIRNWYIEVAKTFYEPLQPLCTTLIKNEKDLVELHDQNIITCAMEEKKAKRLYKQKKKN